MGKIGVVISGGAAKIGFGAGAFAALWRRGVHPEVFVGDSAGALTLMIHPEKIQAVLADVSQKDIYRLNWRLLWKGLKADSIYSTRPLAKFLRENADLAWLRGANGQPSSRRFFFGYTDMLKGTEHYATEKWDPVHAGLISSAIPGFFPAHRVEVAGRWEDRADGGIMSNTPVRKALEEGCTRIFVILSTPIAPRPVRGPITGIVSRLARTMDLMRHALTVQDIQTCAAERRRGVRIVLIHPNGPLHADGLDFKGGEIQKDFLTGAGQVRRFGNKELGLPPAKE